MGVLLRGLAEAFRLFAPALWGLVLLGLAGCPTMPGSRISQPAIDLPPEKPSEKEKASAAEKTISEPRPGTVLRRSPVENSQVELGRTPGTTRPAEPVIDPAKAPELAISPDPRLRAAALRSLARQGHPDANRRVLAGVNDTELMVRLAAIAALADLRTPEARAALDRLAEDRAEMIRAEAVSSLVTLGAPDAIKKAKSDKSPLVRQAAAHGLARFPNREGVTLANEMVTDRSLAVQSEVLSAISAWPLELSGPIYLGAMGQDAFLTRRKATEQLAAVWPPARQFVPDAPAGDRAEVLARVRNQFRQELGFLDRQALAQAHRQRGSSSAEAFEARVAQVERLLQRLTAANLAPETRRQILDELGRLGADLIPVLEEIAIDKKSPLPGAVYTEVLPGVSATFTALARLENDDVRDRRRAATQLVEQSRVNPLGQLAMVRLASLVVAEHDPLVWHSVLEAIAGDPGEPGSRLAYTAAGHRSPEVRRKACEYLQAHPGPEHVRVLLPILDDESIVVKTSAVRALAAVGRLDDTAPLARLLAIPNDPLRLEVAVALVRMSDPAGSAALERLTYSRDVSIRRQAATAMGETTNAAFVPSLVRLLDDQQSVRLAALESLPKVTGRDVPKPVDHVPSTVERIDYWKSSLGDRSPSTPRPLRPGKPVESER